MTTTTAAPPPPDLEKLLQSLQEHPDLAAEFWQRIAAKEVQTLPTTMAELEKSTKESLTQLAAAQARTANQLAEMSRQQQATRRALDDFIAEQRALNAGANERMERCQQEIQTARERADQQHSQALRQIHIERERQDLLNEEFRKAMDEMRGDLSHLKGAEAERYATAHIDGLLRRHDPSLRQIKILKSNYSGSDPETGDQIAEAVAAGKITPQEHEQLQALDLIVRAQPKGQAEPVCYAIEISRTLNEGDLTRARDRARLLAQALNVETRSLALGGSISDINQDLAENMKVSWLTYAPLAR